MTCPKSCRAAVGSGCNCADCRGLQHGVESPQLRLELPAQAAWTEFKATYGLREVDEAAEPPAAESSATAAATPDTREPVVLTVLGHEIRVVPGRREVPDTTVPAGWQVVEVWIATGPRGRASDVTPEAAARAAVRT